MFSVISKTIEWGSKNLTLETGKIARQADGSVIVRYGETTVLCTVVYAKEQSEEVSFFPLTIDYQEKFYSAGRIPGGFVKREGKPSEREVLISRLIDRPIRPLFPEGFFNEVQVVCTTLSYDSECSPEIASMIGASAALSISGVPFLGPIAGCRVGYDKDAGFILNTANKSSLELIVAGTKDGILMVESEANELQEDIMLNAVMFGFDSFQPVIQLIEQFKQKVKKVNKKQTLKVISFDKQYKNILKKIEKCYMERIEVALSIPEKLLRRDSLEKIKNDVLIELSSENNNVILESLFESVLARTMRSNLLKTSKRIDGRSLEQIRPITCEIDILPKVHGSALFTRGETQSLVVTTFGASSDCQALDNIEGESTEQFMLHYNFPPYSVGEIGRMGAPGRREIGHGKLAWRALHPMIPSNTMFPYTIRVVSDITESNGSSSMATVCGSSLSLMSAGVPIKKPVAGVAMGLIKERDKYVILSDIMGDEDHLGDMDFKVAGTVDGITALQMDIKITSINREIIKDALQQAKQGRLHIIDIMNKTISKPRKELSDNAPRVNTLTINKEKIKDLIGPGGKNIKEICEKTQSKIDINDNGTVSVFSIDKYKMIEAMNMVKSICCDPEVGSVFDGKVTKITDFGAFISIGNREGLVHVSNIANHRVNSVSDVLKVGQIVKVKIVSIDDTGRIKLSMKNV